MIFRVAVAAGCVALASVGGHQSARAGDLPAVKVSTANKVMTCATPGRMMAFLKARNDRLDPKFDLIAVDYMRHGESLGMRWDYAFFQMLLETGNLKFGGDVKAAQNNFAGLGATGNGERGESFKDVPTGVRAHLEHLAMYAGEKVENPVAERTRKVQEWGVLTQWQKTIKEPMTFAHVAKKWAPPARKYAQEIEQVSENFSDSSCKSADPRPELVAVARGDKAASVVAAAGKGMTAPVTAAEVVDENKVSGVELAKRAVEDARAGGATKRSALGAGAGAGAAAKVAGKDMPEAAAAATEAPPAMSPAGTAPGSVSGKGQAFALLNPPKPEYEAAPPEKAPTKSPVNKISAGGSAAKAAKPATPSTACKVFTASYGGAKSVIIKAVTSDATLYTVLDVNEGAEARESDAYIAAYAPGGKQVGEYKSQTSALDKAFELCPEG